MRTKMFALLCPTLLCGCGILDTLARLDPADYTAIGKAAGEAAVQAQPGLGLGTEAGGAIGAALFGIRALARALGGKAVDAGKAGGQNAGSV